MWTDWLCVFFVLYSSSIFKINPGLCKNSESSNNERTEPTIVEYFEYLFEIKPHGTDVFRNLGDSYLHRSVQPQEDSIYHNAKYMMKYPQNQSSSPNCAYIGSYDIYRSRSLDHDDLENRRGKFTRWGSDREFNVPDLNELIKLNKSSKGALLVDFFATWCGPCSRMNENLEVIRSHYQADKLTILSIDVDKDERYLNEYEITALPSLLLFVKGYLFKKIVGLVDVKELIREIDNSLDSI